MHGGMHGSNSKKLVVHLIMPLWFLSDDEWYYKERISWCACSSVLVLNHIPANGSSSSRRNSPCTSSNRFTASTAVPDPNSRPLDRVLSENDCQCRVQSTEYSEASSYKRLEFSPCHRMCKCIERAGWFPSIIATMSAKNYALENSRKIRNKPS